MFNTHAGELAALSTAIFWTVTALMFEAASKRMGSLTVNLLRLYLAFVIYSVFTLVSRGMLLPLDATGEAWFWLTLSGLVGFVIGDQLLFQSFVVVGARVSMVIMAFVPPLTALIGWVVLGERLSMVNIIGMGLTITGIITVVMRREKRSLDGKQKKLKFSYPLSGILLTFGGATGQAVGLVLSKYGMKDYNAFAASQIRVMAGMLGFTLIFFALRRWKNIGNAFRDAKGLRFLVAGSVFGPFLGVSFSLLAIQKTETGIASTIMAIVPVLIIPPAVIFFKEKISIREILGALIAVTGVSILFLF
ncbi:MAG: DMT family transporter [Bacteroidales bacterium]|nr:DMT family transporter [Bacteroidales bacterium]